MCISRYTIHNMYLYALYAYMHVLMHYIHVLKQNDEIWYICIGYKIV